VNLEKKSRHDFEGFSFSLTVDHALNVLLFCTNCTSYNKT